MAEWCITKSMTKMKFIFLFVLFWGIRPAVAADLIKFDGEIYALQEVTQSASIQDGYRNVYVRSGETPSMWNKMIVLQSYPDFYDPREAVVQIRQKYPASPAALPGDYTTSKHGLIFPLVLLNANNGNLVYESNIIRFETIKHFGLVSFQYIERFPIPNMKNADNVLEIIENDRDRLVQMIRKIDMPSITKEKKQ